MVLLRPPPPRTQARPNYSYPPGVGLVGLGIVCQHATCEEQAILFFRRRRENLRTKSALPILCDLALAQSGTRGDWGEQWKYWQRQGHGDRAIWSICQFVCCLSQSIGLLYRKMLGGGKTFMSGFARAHVLFFCCLLLFCAPFRTLSALSAFHPHFLFSPPFLSSFFLFCHILFASIVP